MIDLHVISNLSLYLYEPISEEDINIPKCDLVLINGNCGYVKRTMVYVEALCKKYPDITFILNLGVEEMKFQKNDTEITDGLLVRQSFSELWPKNLIFSLNKPIELVINGKNISILCVRGYPYTSDETKDDATWRAMRWYRFAYHGITHDQNDFKPKEAADVYHGHFPVWSTPELCRVDHDRELEIVKNWLANSSTDSCKILATTISPVNDATLAGLEYSLFPDISPDYWIVGGNKIHQVSNSTVMYGNPGRGELARSSILNI